MVLAILTGYSTRNSAPGSAEQGSPAGVADPGMGALLAHERYDRRSGARLCWAAVPPARLPVFPPQPAVLPHARRPSSAARRPAGPAPARWRRWSALPIPSARRACLPPLAVDPRNRRRDIGGPQIISNGSAATASRSIVVKISRTASGGAPSIKAGMTEFCKKVLSRMTVCWPCRQRSASRRH